MLIALILNKNSLSTLQTRAIGYDQLQDMVTSHNRCSSFKQLEADHILFNEPPIIPFEGNVDAIKDTIKATYPNFWKDQQTNIVTCLTICLINDLFDLFISNKSAKYI